jgi:hypothetical protein
MLDTWRKEQAQREEERARSAARALAGLRDEQRWQVYHDALDSKSRQWWQKRGIPSSYVDYWRLGWRADMSVFKDGQSYSTPSATIPLFAQGGDAVNIKHRLVSPPPGIGKYRYELTGQPQPLFYADPDKPLLGEVVAIEGEIKAMVTFVTMNGPAVAVVGMPGNTPSPEIVALLKQAERLTLVMDPGAQAQALALARQFDSKHVRLLVTSEKIDDVILNTRATSNDVARWLKEARSVA